MGDTLFFTADDGTHGTELWKSDGTEAGTVLVKDINPGAGWPFSLTVLGSALFFGLDDGVRGGELWKSDGTEAGTVLVKDVVQGAGGSNPNSQIGVGETLFFTADDGSHGRELWKSDGTEAGTVLVKDIRPGAGPSNIGYEGGPWTGVGGTLFFTANDGIHGYELWKSDGTEAGTVLVKDINPDRDGYYVSAPSWLTEVGGTLFFSADDGTRGLELWKSDGTEAGTVLVKDVYPDDGHSGSPSYLNVAGGELFFSADDGTQGAELWKSDGTEAGTVLVKNINPNDMDPSFPSSLASWGEMLFFNANDGTVGDELWKSDGTEAGTVLVKDINPNGYNGSFPHSFVPAGEVLFFTADDGSHGRELWSTDGTEAGTVLTKDIMTGDGYYNGSMPHGLTGVAGRLFFGADDGARGYELWTSDGTEAGTVLVKDINAGGGFTVAARGRPNPRTGTMRVRVTTQGAGRLVVRPVGGSELRRSAQDVAAAAPTRVILRPTKAGLRILKKVGRLRVKARFTFTPCGGTGSSVTRRFILRMR